MTSLEMQLQSSGVNYVDGQLIVVAPDFSFRRNRGRASSRDAPNPTVVLKQIRTGYRVPDDLIAAAGLIPCRSLRDANNQIDQASSLIAANRYGVGIAVSAFADVVVCELWRD